MKIKLKNVLFLIGAIIFAICLTIMTLCLISVVCELCIDSFGLNIWSIITVVVGCICISPIVIRIIATIQTIKCILFYK